MYVYLHSLNVAVALLPYGDERAQVQIIGEFHQLRATTGFP